jgi:eukaryotic-like serine/threonine-protein kinase
MRQASSRQNAARGRGRKALRCGIVSSSAPNLAALPSESAGAYEFVTELARGALGPLFGARVRAGGDQDRVVAIRRIPIECCAREDVQAIAETASIARRVRHSKVAPLLEAVVTERELLLVGEYVDGYSLSSLLRLAIAKRAPLPPSVVLRIGLELLRGLRAMRETWRAVAPSGARVAPRGGISPDNVFLAAFGEVLLSEVGVSAVASALVPFRTFPGILAYLSPEQVRDNGAQPIDERAEVFNVGVILWELLANRPLFGDAERLHADPDDQSLALADRILEDVESKPIAALSSIECSSSPTVRAAVEVIERALQRDPAARFADIDQMRVALLALNREAMASSEQVRTAFQALAGSEIAAQRAALGLPDTRPSARPGSARDSKRPSLPPQAPDPPATPSARACRPKLPLALPPHQPTRSRSDHFPAYPNPPLGRFRRQRRPEAFARPRSRHRRPRSRHPRQYPAFARLPLRHRRRSARPKHLYLHLATWRIHPAIWRIRSRARQALPLSHRRLPANSAVRSRRYPN